MSVVELPETGAGVGDGLPYPLVLAAITGSAGLTTELSFCWKSALLNEMPLVAPA